MTDSSHLTNNLLSTLSSDSPSITLNSPILDNTNSPPRSPSLSPSSSPPLLASSATSRSAAAAGMFASRPSPVVPSPSLPASPSFSRPTSPRPNTRERNDRDREREAALEGTTGSPARSTHDLSLSASASVPDLSHIFERDVEFHSTHHISPQEAVDVAIPPVLDEAAVALSTSDEVDLASLVRDAAEAQGDVTGSGWSSPVVPPPLAPVHPSHHSYASASRSPVRGGLRSFSPDSAASGGGGGRDGGAAGRAISPVSSGTSFSINTPSSSPPSAAVTASLYPFSQHLADALESEARKAPAFPSPLGAGAGSGAGVPFPSTDGISHSPSPMSTAGLPGSPSMEALHERRRLSFISYADVINEERLAELTGAPVGGTGGTPSRSVSVSGATPLDLGSVLGALPGHGEGSALRMD